MSHRHDSEVDYQADVANYRTVQAGVIPRLREQTADRPAHAAFLDQLLAADSDDARWDLAWADHLPKGVGRGVAEALADDVCWALNRDPLTRGYFWSTGGHQYREQRVKDGRAADDRRRSIAARERYENSLEGILAGALTPRARR